MQKVLVRGIGRVQIHNVCDCDAVLVAREQVYRIAGCNLSLLHNCKVEPNAPAAQQPLDHVGASEPNGELETRHSRLSHDEFCGADRKPVTDTDSFLVKQAFRCEVLAEG